MFKVDDELVNNMHRANSPQHRFAMKYDNGNRKLGR